VNPSRLERLLRLAARTEAEELSCSECFDVLPQYVDLEIAGETPDARLPTFRQHLEQCAVCREEYETVRELARLEAEGRSPSIDDLRRSL
jgi:predicted anti-sigma-YlaC factor YlaD